MAKKSALATQQLFTHLANDVLKPESRVLFVEKAIEHGADLKAKQALPMFDRYKFPELDNHTPLMYAVHFNRLECIDLLIKSGANPNIGNGDQKPLMMAIYNKNMEMTKLLLDLGANVNQRGSNKNTPLHCAALMNRHEWAKLFLEYGADIKLKNMEKRTPALVADFSGFKVVAELIRSNYQTSFFEEKALSASIEENSSMDCNLQF